LFFFVAPVAAPVSPQETQTLAPPQTAPPQGNTPPQASVPPQATTPSATVVQPSGPVIIINPAHGGTDTGARGQDGTAEKDIVLLFARALRGELEREGYRATLTRNDDSNPSYDDRAAAANGYRDAIFVSLHVSSTGTLGAVRAYYEQLPAVSLADAEAQDENPVGQLTAWNDAQRAYLDASLHLASFIQTQCAQSFPGSPALPQLAAIRDLRSVEAPAVAVELSSVSGGNVEELRARAPTLAAAIAHGIQAFRGAGGK
jgi:N-acetylmuramoyl-L-alanine amidase